MHALPIPQYIFWVGMSFVFGGLWLFAWLVRLLGGGFFVCICKGMAALSCFFSIKFPALSAEFFVPLAVAVPGEASVEQ